MRIRVADDHNNKLASIVKKVIFDAFYEHTENQEADAKKPKLPFILGLSGGSLVTPATLALLDLLVQHRDAHVKLIFCDERAVPLTHDQSNYRAYLNNVDAVKIEYPAHAIDHLIGSLVAIDGVKVDDVVALATDYDNRLRLAFNDVQNQFTSDDTSVGSGVVRPMNLAILGMGDDGHTCSLFANHPAFKTMTEGAVPADMSSASSTCPIVVPITDSPKPPDKRVTLTLKYVNQSQRVAFICTGEGKAEVVRRVIEDRDMTLPATHIKLHSSPTSSTVKGDAFDDLIWILDAGSASKLSK